MNMKNFSMVPNELLDTSDLPVIERYLHCVLLKFCGQKDTCFPSQATLAKILDVSERHVRTLLKNLEVRGLIRKTRRGWNRANTYEVAKRFIVDRNSSSYQIGSMFPLHQGSEVPPKNTYLTGKGKRSIKGIESIREVIDRIKEPD